MAVPSYKFTSKKICSIIRQLFFFGFFFYLLFVINVSLIAHTSGYISNFPVFLKGFSFLKGFLFYPSGCLEYCSAFLAQLMYFPAAGALLITAQSWLICFLTQKIFKTLGFKKTAIISYLCGLFILVTYARYTFFFETTMAFLFGLLFINIYLKTPLTSHRQIIKNTLLSIIFYYVAGGVFIFAAGVCITYELLFRKRIQPGVLLAVLALSLPYILGVMIFKVTIIDAYASLMPYSWKLLEIENRSYMIGFIFALYLLLPVILLVLGSFRIIFSKSSVAKKVSSDSSVNKDNAEKKSILFFFTGTAGFSPALETVIVMLLLSITAYFAYDKARRDLFLADYYSLNSDWENAFKVAKQYPAQPPYMTHVADLSLYKNGRMAYDLFKIHSTRQNLSALLARITDSNLSHWRRAWISLHLGMINQAQQHVTITLESFGAQPEILKRLAYIYMIKQDIVPAKIILSSLKKTLFHNDWAEEYLSKLQKDPQLNREEDILHFRKLITKTDKPFDSERFETTFLWLLEDRKNRMAFEYLMSLYMLRKDSEKVVENLYRLRDYGYDAIPPLYEEAVLFYEYQTKKKAELYEYTISKETQRKFDDMLKIDKQYESDKAKKISEIVKKYPYSYISYCISKIER